jgi:Family of unknown function (DUF5684)
MNTFVWIIYIAFIVLSIAGLWCVFVKAREEGWKAIIPIWNTLVLLKVIGRPWWWILLFLIPIVNIVIWIIVANDLSKSFGRGVGTTIGLIFLEPIFVMIIGFGDSEYQGPAAQTPSVAPAV